MAAPAALEPGTSAPERIVRELFRTAAGRADPYPFYRDLRAAAPVHHSAEIRSWVFTRYADCHALLRDPRLVQGFAASLDRRRPAWRERQSFRSSERWLVNLDGAEHARLRRSVVKAFTGRTVEALRPGIEALVGDLLDAFGASGGGELMASVAFPLPVRVIGDLLGLPPADLPPFRALAQHITATMEPSPSEAELDAADGAARQLDAYFGGFVAGLRGRPAPGLLGALAAGTDDADRLSDAELTALGTLLLFAGFETTTHLIGNGVVALLADPAQLHLLRARPELLPHLSDELLRFDSSVQVVTRLATEAVQVGGVRVEPGQNVVLLLGAANRDPARYARPDALDVTRPDVRPLGFGHGVHYCVGAALARLEVEVFFRALLDRFGSISLAGPPTRRGGIALRGMDTVPLRLGP